MTKVDKTNTFSADCAVVSQRAPSGGSQHAPSWPALMRPDTLKAYLDCRSDTDFARKLQVLVERRGYPGMDRLLHRHVKEIVDRYIDDEGSERERRKVEMRKAARGEINT